MHKQTLLAGGYPCSYRDEMDLDVAIHRRRKNLRRLSEDMGQEELAHRLGCSGSYVSQLITATRPITEKTARKYEARLGKPPGWLDIDHGALDTAAAPADAQDLIALLLNLPEQERNFWIRMIRDAPRRK